MKWKSFISPVLVITLFFAALANARDVATQPSSAVPPVETLSDDKGDYVIDTQFPQWVKDVSESGGAAPVIELTECVSPEGAIPDWAYPLPVEPVKCVALSRNGGELWAATGDGVIFLELVGKRKLYFHGKRWLPDDDVKSVGVTEEGDAFATTAKGAVFIRRKMMTMEEKALYFDEVTQARHNREGMVTNSGLREPGNPDSFFLTDDDNDGQWTQMYLAAESFRYAATGDPDALRNAKDSFRAMVRLMTVTPVKGYVARSVLPIDKCPGSEPQNWRYHPTNKDICWKTDTSKDELVGHYFGFPIYFDLVADEEDKETIRRVITDVTDRLVENGMKFLDENGNVTSWGHMDPEWVNTIGTTGDQGLNSLAALNILRSAYHMTGKQAYLDEYWKLIKEHDYHKNVLKTKEISDRFQVNHDSDEMAALGFYNLIRYEDNEKLRDKYFLEGLRRLWNNDLPERNAEQIAIYGAFQKTDFALAPAIRALREIPLDLVNWSVNNSHRKDIEIDINKGRFQELQSRQVLPYTEVRTMRWSFNMYALESADNAGTERDATFWLLPYWMMRYHGIIRVK